MNERQRTYQLRHIVERAKTLPFYAERLANLDVTEVWVDDLSKLPTMTRAELRAHFAAHPPDGGFLQGDIVQVEPAPPEGLPHYLTRNGQIWQAEATATYFAHCGLNDRNRCLIALEDNLDSDMPDSDMPDSDMFKNDMALGRWLFYDGLVDLGVTVVRSPTLDATTITEVAQHYDVDVLVATHGRAEAVAAAGGRFQTLVLVGSVPSVPEASRNTLAARLGARVFDSYARAETGLVAGDTLGGGGMEVVGSAAIVEVLAPGGLEPTPEGSVGEVVVTSLTREGLPILRLRTGDLALKGYQDEDLLVLPRGIIGSVDTSF